MSEYLAFKDQALIDGPGPATHAMIIGVGEYPHLNGGEGPITTLNGGLKQLSSPPESAREIITWLLDEFHNPEKPLASVSLLISEKDSAQPYTHMKLDQPFTPQEATVAHMQTAAGNWKEMGDSNEDSLMLFFYCGHGVSGSFDGLTLLLQDYGKNNHMPMDGAVDFAALQRGMSQCAASNQCYFVDACRTRSGIATDTSAQGRKIIQDNLVRPWQSDCEKAVFYSTLEGEKAYGRKNKPSFFTEELIRALNGPGSNNRSGDGLWRVSTNGLSTALHRGLSLRGDKLKPPMAELCLFDFHQLQREPLVPIMVYCESESDTELATFSCLQDGHTVSSRMPEPDKWQTDIIHGTYDFLAELDSIKGERKDLSIMPPYREIQIKMEAGT